MKILNLNSYSDKIKYVYVDLLIKYNNINKYDLFKELGIGYNSFKTDKYRGKSNNDNIKILFDYYRINDVLESDITVYEEYINRIYYAIYFKEEEKIKILLDKIEEFINQNNYLKPLFILFKIFAYVNLNMHISRIKELILSEVEYLMSFNNYFVEEYEIIYKSMMLVFDFKINTNKISVLCIKYPAFKWIYLLAAGSHCYVNRRDYDALDYYLELYDDFQENNNMERAMMVASNISFLYNAVNKYILSIKYSSKIINYVYSSKETKWISFGLQHYLFSHFMLDDYQTIIDFVNNELFERKKLNMVSKVIIILAYYKVDDLDTVEELIDLYKDEYYVSLVKQFIKDKDINHLVDFKKFTYLNKIYSKLK